MRCIVQRCRILDGQHCLIFFHSLHRFLSMRSTNCFWSHILVSQETIGGLGRSCRLTHKFARRGRYASEEENGEDMCQILIICSLSALARTCCTTSNGRTKSM